MKLEQSFEVSAPLERVWAALIDVERVAPCLPGAAVTGRNDDGSYNGTFSVKIGPTSASYAGRLAMQEVDESAHRATMQAHGTDKRGQGGADATIVSSLRALDDGRTLVEVATDYRITGRLARFGRGGMIEDISEKLLRQFATYQPLRFAIEDPERQARYASVFAITAGAFVPLNFIAVRLAQQYVHPRVLTLEGGNLPGSMALTFYISLLGIALLYATLWNYEMAAKNARGQVRALRRMLLGDDSIAPLRRSAAPS